MWRILACILSGGFLIGAIWPPPQVLAQQVEAGQKQKAAEFVRLYERSKQTQDPDEKVTLAERLLALEPALMDWPLPTARERVKGELWFDAGYAYADVHRFHGDRAESLEKAIAAYEAALAVFTREALPHDWANTQNNLAIAYAERIRGERADNLEKAIVAYEAALTVRTREALPREWAVTQNNLAISYADRVRGDQADNLEKAIEAFEAALTVFTREALPYDWAQMKNNVGLTYVNRIRGDRADNLEKAIVAYEAALTVFTREALPYKWATAQNNVGLSYADRIRGDQADNLEKAIVAFEAALAVFTREALPYEWARTQHNLGIAYGMRIRGDRAGNFEKAIAAYEHALTVFARDALRHEWANSQNSLGNAYAQRVRGDRADNWERAIGAYEASLTVRTREALPHDWALTQSNLGNAYADRVRGDRGDNLEKAIASYEAALTVRTREAMPLDWAEVQENLAGAYRRRMRGDRADNLEKAIAAYEGVFTVVTREALPHHWARAQYALGLSYGDRIRGDPADNVEKAIEALNRVLTVATREALPFRWAQTQDNLAVAYQRRIRGERADNLKKAIIAYEAALTVRTPDALPREHLRTARFLGGVWLEAGEWHRAALAFGSAREAFRLLFGQGLNDAEARDLIAEAGSLFAEAAFSAAQLGERETALTLASEGRARLMAVALKLQTLNLAAHQRQRLDELRAAIRVEQRVVEVEQGVKRTAAIGKLLTLRQELLGLIEGADRSKSGPRSALAQARAAVSTGGAVVVPVITKVGAKVLIVTAAANGPTVLDLPQLTTDRLNELLRGDGKSGGWLRAYTINYLQGTEQNRRWPDWLSAVSDLGPELWGLFAARLDAALKQRGVKRGARLVWLPTGALGILPLGLAQDPVTKRRLADHYEIVYSPSLEALTSAQYQVAQVRPTTLAAIINPTGDLAGTEKEGKLVASHFPSKQRTVLEQSAATPDAVITALKGKTHWHFASHGTFSWEDARQSGLIMHDRAPLSVGRLLETDGLGRPRLVVLSACETGLYDIRSSPDEFIGLPGAFTALGAAGVLGTLWPVSDAATALLIARFYELHMGQGLPPPTALSQAQKWLRQATNRDLLAYAGLAAKQGRLDSRHVAEIEEELSEEGLNRSRNRALIEWITPRVTGDTGKKKTHGTPSRLARPYAHPYYWAGFIHTGL